MNSNKKAVVTQIKFGQVEFEGLMLPDGNFGVAVPQVCSLFQILIKNAQRDIKALMGEGFQYLKYSSTLHPKAVNVLLLPDFEKLTLELAIRGNEEAQNFCRILVGLSLQQLFSDAFKIKFEAEDRQEWLKQRQERIKQFRQWTDVIKEKQIEHGYYRTPKGDQEFAVLIAKYNKALFGVKGYGDRDKMTDEEQLSVKAFEGLLIRIFKKNSALSATEIVDKAIAIWE